MAGLPCGATVKGKEIQLLSCNITNSPHLLTHKHTHTSLLVRPRNNFLDSLFVSFSLLFYSGTSNKGPSEKRTISLDALLIPFSYHNSFDPRDKDSLSTEDRVADLNVSFIWRFHCCITYSLTFKCGGAILWSWHSSKNSDNNTWINVVIITSLRRQGGFIHY